MSTRFVNAVILSTAGVLAAVTAASAQTAGGQTPVLLVLDKDAIDYGPAPHLLPSDAVDPDIAGIGVREELRYFQSHLGAQVVLTSGQNGSDGWFALRTAPPAWSTAEGGDSLENYSLAGPGVGSPDDNGDRESLLVSVPDVVPVRADGLALLVGQPVCAVVYSGDMSVTAGAPTNLQGPTLGRIGFTVVSVIPTDDPAHPNVQVQIAEGHELCTGALAPFATAPDVQ